MNYTGGYVVSISPLNVTSDISCGSRLLIGSDVSMNGNVYVKKNMGIGVTSALGMLDICGSVVRNVVTASGYLGLGTTLPGYPLDVSGDTRIASTNLILGTTTTKNTLLTFNATSNNTGTSNAYIGIANLATNLSNYSNAGDFIIRSNGNRVLIQPSLSQQGLTINTGGLVGVGKTTPNCILHLSTPLFDTSNNITFEAGCATSGAAVGFSAMNFNGYAGGGNGGLGDLINTNKGRWRMYCEQTGNNDYLGFDWFNGSSYTKVITCLSNGYVGIGTNNTNPSFPLQVYGTGAYSSARFGNTIPLYLINGSASVGFNCYYGTGGWTNGSNSVSSTYSGFFTFAENVGTLYFKVSGATAISDGTVFTPTTILTLTQNGNLSSPGTVGSSSDIRLKTNIRKIQTPIEKIKKIGGYTYDRVDTNMTNQMGVIAQELVDVVPEVLLQDENGYYSVAYGNLTALLIEGMKEQQQMIDLLTQRLNAAGL